MSKKVTTEIFIDKANLIHNEKYDYSKSIYLKTHTKIKIICLIHGEFLQTPASHLSGRGCPKCKNKNQSNIDIINRCIKIHGTDFDYSNVNYINMKDKVEIKCNSCNTIFLQCLDKHINAKQGCPVCKQSKGESLIRLWLINNNITYITQYKINLGDLCIERQNIKVDFYIEINKHKYVIEYDGKQHFEYDRFYHKDNIENFNTQKKRDNALTEFCKNNNFKLLRFDYTQNDENVIGILNKTFNKK